MFELLNRVSPIEVHRGEGRVTKTVYTGKKWRVQFEATEWFAVARNATTFNKDDVVQVIGMIDATTLLIEPQ